MDWSKLKMVPSATVTFTTSSAARSIHAMLPRKAIRVQTSARATWGEYVWTYYDLFQEIKSMVCLLERPGQTSPELTQGPSTQLPVLGVQDDRQQGHKEAGSKLELEAQVSAPVRDHWVEAKPMHRKQHRHHERERAGVHLGVLCTGSLPTSGHMDTERMSMRQF